MIPSNEFVHNKLRDLGPLLLNNQYSSSWTISNPTYGYCYVVSEAIYHYLNENVEVYCMNLGKDYGTHWFTKINGKIIDFTKDQFPFEIDYSIAKRKGFFKGGVKTQKGFISKRGYEMAKYLGLTA